MDNDDIWDGEITFINIEEDNTAYLVGPDGLHLRGSAQRALAEAMLRYVDEWGDEAIDNLREAELAEIRAKDAKRRSEPRRAERRSLYLISAGGNYKVGVSKDPNRRLKEILRHQPDAELVAVSKPVTTHRAFEVEKQFHNVLSNRLIVSEWFKLSETEANKVAVLITEAVDEQ
jgi:hypothetical protein